ncbi:MAG: hypothetical protein AB1725_12760, partial [Armatimonadota bacterium]
KPGSAGDENGRVRLEDETNVERLREKALVLARENERLSTKVVVRARPPELSEGARPDGLRHPGVADGSLFYSLIETAKLNAVDPKAYLKRALAAALAGAVIPLPHELAAAR